jgi:DNA-binding response OmpR family regulator
MGDQLALIYPILWRNRLMNKSLVLIVEDHPLMRETLPNALQLEGMDTLTVDRGDQALVLLRVSSPDLVILDVELPGALSGLDVLLAIRREPRIASTVVVLHTSEPGVANMAEAEAADLVLLKPADLDQILMLMQRFLKTPA